MTMRCIKCWNKVVARPVVISNDFEGCFCRDCFDESANEFLELIKAFINTSNQDEADDLFSQIEDYSDNLELSIDGQDLLFGYLSQKSAEKQSAESIDINLMNEAISREKGMSEIEYRNKQMRKGFIAVTCNNIEGYRIAEYHGIATGTAVMGKGIFTGMADSGGEKVKLSGKMEEVKNQAMEYAIDSAISMGGNALIATKVDFNTITTAGGVIGPSSVNIAVMVSGTAVTIEKIVND